MTEDAARPRVRLAEAGPNDRFVVLGMARALHDEDGHPLTARGEDALTRLLAEPALGRVWLIEVEGQAAGYAAVCFGFSIEWGGRDAFLDDLYVAPGFRDRGVGAAAIELAAEKAKEHGCTALHLEVLGGNPAERLYRRCGFADRGSLLMTRHL